MNKFLYLIRHAKTEGNLRSRYIGITDEPLSEQGIFELREHIAAGRYTAVEHVFVSPMLRCLQTKELIYPNVPYSIIPELAECSFGIFENKSYEQLKDLAEYQSWIDSGGKQQIPGGDQPEMFKSRCLEGFSRVIQKVDEAGIEQAGLIIHGGTIMMLLEAFSPEIFDFYHWQIKNGEGYQLTIDQDLWAENRKLAAIAKI
ncbi:histidine phosphatase family protein [Dehalobacter sp. TBBPA1]|uniref:histidine phosphatase family protein n=1 Tax=Dehalobacter sp. TBBPA1 TaxID=3235037 RepID=UPI0034A23304